MNNDENSIKALKLKCAFSDDGHFVIEPIQLSCGHWMCQNCTPISHFEEIICKICGLVSKQDLTKFSVSDHIFQDLNKEITDRLKEFKGIYLNRYSTSDFYNS